MDKHEKRVNKKQFLRKKLKIVKDLSSLKNLKELSSVKLDNVAPILKLTAILYSISVLIFLFEWVYVRLRHFSSERFMFNYTP